MLKLLILAINQLKTCFDRRTTADHIVEIAAQTRQSQHDLHIHLIADKYPGQSTGTEIVLLRHLMKLGDEGWRVSVTAPATANSRDNVLPVDWQKIDLPARRWWWPPYRQNIPLLENIRVYLAARFLAVSTKTMPPSHVIGVAHGYMPSVALAYARLSKAKFHLIIHDRDELWANSAYVRKFWHSRVINLAQKADKVLAVTQDLLSWYAVPTDKGVVLLPVPGSRLYKPQWTQERGNRIRLIHAGSIKPGQEEIFNAIAIQLQIIGGTLTLISPPWDTIAEQLCATHMNIDKMPMFTLNEEAVEYVADNAFAFLTCYSFDVISNPISETSFPSKLLEFIRAGVPALIVAPPTAAVTKWAKEAELSTICTSIDPDALRQMLQKIVLRDGWERARDRALALAAGQCSAETIHSRFVEALQG